MTTTCDLNVDWNKCPNCARLKARVDDAEAAALAASERVDQTYDEYRFERDAGRAVICTSQWSAWRDRIDNLEQALDAAHATWTAAVDEWAASIHAHRRGETAAADTATGTAETEEMPTFLQDDEPTVKEDKLARELFGELRYGDVPDFDLPDDFEDRSWVSLHSASVAVRVYMILLERYAPRAAKGYPTWVANRLRDVLDEAAIQRAITDQGGRK